MAADPSGVEVDLDRTRYLRFDHNACADLDAAMFKHMGISLYEAFVKNDDDKNEESLTIMMGPSAVRLMVWAGLKWQIKGLTIEGAGKMIHTAVNRAESPARLQDIIQSCMQAVVNSGLFGNPDKLQEEMEKQANDPKEEATPTAPAMEPSPST